MSSLAAALGASLGVLILFLVLPLVVGQAEHKLMGRMQGRLGPMEAGGFHGWAQLIADGVKFAQKEDIVPAGADRGLFRLAPGLALLPSLLAFSLIPWSPRLVAVDPPASVLAVIAAMALGVLGTVAAGWASGSKYALLGGIRTVAQLVAYELPLVLAVTSVALAAGTLSLQGVVEAWRPWWLVWQAPAALVFLLAGLAELSRTPFDAPVADSEVVMGPWTEYTGLRFAFFLLAEYAGIVVLSLLFTVLFLGGWQGPWAAGLGWLWTALKAALVAVVVIWVRVSLPRLRPDQTQRLAWLVLVPLALLQILVTTLVVVLA